MKAIESAADSLAALRFLCIGNNELRVCEKKSNICTSTDSSRETSSCITDQAENIYAGRSN